ncbi:MAG: DUF2442 domain-containing protein [Magnetococcales bacterium]|nr:DUF2442 domain-containing protein [Magnetococcales bacterium]MBF0415443.1 DUF2442 domain-containing protein [Magnetococcales bacterium]
MVHVTDVNYLGDYCLWLTFDNGTVGIVNLEPELWGEIFLPLKDKTAFASVRVDQELGTVVWANGADFAPEFLLERLQQEAVA